ncbi:MAG: ABC transporter substrate-binding protein [Sulfuricaulis sp.]|nr:ABC transporter substrate-binding protein [Sulfuricaulis sp.]
MKIKVNGWKASGIAAMGRCLVAAALMTAGAAQAQVQGVTNTEIVLGAVLDLSGPVASAGTPERDGMILAVEEINAAGGVNGRKIRLLVEDAAYDPKRGVLVTQKLISEDKVFATIGSFGSAIVQATMPMSIERGVPLLFPMVGTDIAHLPYHPLKFGLFTGSTAQTRAGVKYAYDKLGKRRFGILYQDDETGLGALRSAEEQLKVFGLKFIETTSYKRGDTNFSAQIARLKAANVDVVILGTIVREAAGAAIEAKAQNWQVDMVSPWATTAIITLGGAAVEGLYATTQFPGPGDNPSAPYKAIVDRFTARFGRPMTDQGSTGYGYTAIMLFAEGATKAGRDLTTQTFSRGMEQVRNFKTAFEMPSISYGPNQHGSSNEIFVMQAKGGKWVKIDGPLSY